MTPPAQTGGVWTENVLHGFAGPASHHGGVPTSALIIGGNGILFGTTNYGRPAGYGTLFEMALPAQSGGVWTESVLHSFTGQNGDGSGPLAGLVVARPECSTASPNTVGLAATARLSNCRFDA